MALTTLAIVKTALGIPASNSSQDALITQLITEAQTIIANYCKRTFELTSYTEYYSGRGRRDVILKNRPVPTVTSLWLDQTGYYGQGTSSPFAASTLLTPGDDYVLVYDDNVPQSNCGLLRRLPGSAAAFWPDYYGEAAGGTGVLAARKQAAWPIGEGTIKVAYTAGYTTIPADLESACNQLVAFLRRTGPAGAALVSETLGSYTYTVDTTVPKDIGTIKQILARYREKSVG